MRDHVEMDEEMEQEAQKMIEKQRQGMLNEEEKGMNDLYESSMTPILLIIGINFIAKTQIVSSKIDTGSKSNFLNCLISRTERIHFEFVKLDVVRGILSIHSCKRQKARMCLHLHVIILLKLWKW
jgi:hypothetical protein